MSKVTAEMVKTLRERTGVGMSKCKKALDEANGDMDQAIDNLRKAGIAIAVKKEGRESKEGLIDYAETDQAIAVVELTCETDFVAQNEKFREFLNELCKETLKAKPATVEELVKLPHSASPDMTIEEVRAQLVLSLGENIQIKRIQVVSKEGGRSYGVYSHTGGRIFVLVELGGDTDQGDLAKDIAMHTAAEAPEYLSPEDVPADVIQREKEVAKGQSGDKPDDVINKMNSFYEQMCLTNQKFVKDSSMTIEQLLEEAGKKAGQPIQLVQFIRWQIGS